jgi:hypothetical protein
VDIEEGVVLDHLRQWEKDVLISSVIKSSVIRSALIKIADVHIESHEKVHYWCNPWN